LGRLYKTIPSLLHILLLCVALAWSACTNISTIGVVNTHIPQYYETTGRNSRRKSETRIRRSHRLLQRYPFIFRSRHQRAYRRGYRSDKTSIEGFGDHIIVSIASWNLNQCESISVLRKKGVIVYWCFIHPFNLKPAFDHYPSSHFTQPSFVLHSPLAIHFDTLLALASD
jgi:hypothetical protein